MAGPLSLPAAGILGTGLQGYPRPRAVWPVGTARVKSPNSATRITVKPVSRAWLRAWDTALVATAGGLYGLMVTVTVPLTMLPCASCTCMGKLNVPAWAGVPVRTLL